MTIDVATGISRILKEEGVGWVSTFPVCRVNNALGREGVPMLMMRDDRYAVAVADAFSRITAGSQGYGSGCAPSKGASMPPACSTPTPGWRRPMRMARPFCASPTACRPAARATASTMSHRR